jgi:YHS domain-containing protein
MMAFDTIVYLALFVGAFLLLTRYDWLTHVLGDAHGHGGSGSDSARAAGGSPPLSAGRDVDRVCGMTVEKASANSAVHEGQAYYFCSQTCREKFEAAPATYAKKTGAAPNSGGNRHGCC